MLSAFEPFFAVNRSAGSRVRRDQDVPRIETGRTLQQRTPPRRNPTQMRPRRHENTKGDPSYFPVSGFRAFVAEYFAFSWLGVTSLAGNQVFGAKAAETRNAATL